MTGSSETSVHIYQIAQVTFQDTVIATNIVTVILKQACYHQLMRF